MCDSKSAVFVAEHLCLGEVLKLVAYCKQSRRRLHITDYPDIVHMKLIHLVNDCSSLICVSVRRQLVLQIAHFE